MPQGNWFGPTENISSGWTPYHYTAPDIGSLVGNILQNRRWEQANLQNQMSGLGKAIQAQQQNQAFGEQASNAGLLPGVDTSGMNAEQIASLAKLVQQQGSEATMDAYRRALGGAVTTRANAYAADKTGGGDDGSGAPTAPETYTDPNTGLQWARGPAGRWQLVPRYGQRGSAAPGSADNAPSLEPQIITPDDGGDQSSTAPAAPSAPAAPGSIAPGPPADQTVVPREPQKPVSSGESIDPTTAQQYLIKAQGNKSVAQRMAQSDGWTW